MSKRKKIIAIMIVIAVVLLVGLFGYGIWKKYAAKETAKENTEEYEGESYITYKGKRLSGCPPIQVLSVIIWLFSSTSTPLRN